MKIVTPEEAVAHIKDGDALMIGGFLTGGTPESLVDAIVEKKIKNLTVIANDAGLPGKGIAKLISAKLVKKLIASHIGMNPEAGEQMNSGEMEIVLVPQGTLAEQIRSGGSGLGGVLTPTGIGTSVAEGKQIINIDGKDFLLEKPIKADVALIKGSLIDRSGNMVYKGTNKNFNPLMAMAAELVIAEAEELVDVGVIAHENISTPYIFVDYVVGGQD